MSKSIMEGLIFFFVAWIFTLNHKPLVSCCQQWRTRWWMHTWALFGTCYQHSRIAFPKKGGLTLDLSNLLLCGTFGQKRKWLKTNNRLWAPFSGRLHLWARVHETHLRSREPLMLRWLTSIQSWSAELKTGLVGRGAGKSRKASSSRSRVGVVGWLSRLENTPSGRSAPGSCPVDTVWTAQFKVLFPPDSCVSMTSIRRPNLLLIEFVEPGSTLCLIFWYHLQRYSPVTNRGSKISHNQEQTPQEGSRMSQYWKQKSLSLPHI